MCTHYEEQHAVHREGRVARVEGQSAKEKTEEILNEIRHHQLNQVTLHQKCIFQTHNKGGLSYSNSIAVILQC